MRNSRVLDRLRRNEAVLVISLTLSPAPLAVEVAGRCGIDCAWIDLEHRPWSWHEIFPMLQAGRLADIDCMVRVRKGEGYTTFFRPLEDGAAGIMVPHVKTREEAEMIVSNSRFPPAGRRGLETMMPDADLGFSDPLEFTRHANQETFVCIQIEDVEALDALDEIASVPGVDILFIGPADLSFSMGIPLQLEHPDFQDGVSLVAQAARRHGKWWGLPVPDAATATQYARRGARFFAVGGDYGMLRSGCTRARSEFDAAMS